MLPSRARRPPSDPVLVGAAAAPALVEWLPGARVGPALRRKVERLLGSLTPVLSEFEADLDGASRRAACGYAWLLPRFELTLPLYEDQAVFRLRMTRLDEPEMLVVTRNGRAVARVRLG